jgi:hypothetical protein
MLKKVAKIGQKVKAKLLNVLGYFWPVFQFFKIWPKMAKNKGETLDCFREQY